jgi:hypothetical protein
MIVDVYRKTYRSSQSEFLDLAKENTNSLRLKKKRTAISLNSNP